ncbi:MAG: hypothetical protein JWL57_3314 [Actinobacteria bacterium]|nr:hypothetical protein [Actinomycetota bacterium]
MVGARPLFRALVGLGGGWVLGAGLRRAGVALVRLRSRWPAQSALPPVTHPPPCLPSVFSSARLKGKGKAKQKRRRSDPDYF